MTFKTKIIVLSAKNCTILHNNSISPIANLHQYWRGFDLLWSLHKKEGVRRAGEAGEQARALGYGKGGVCCLNGPL